MDPSIAIGSSVQLHDTHVPSQASVKTNDDDLVTFSGIVPKTTSSAVVSSGGSVEGITNGNGFIAFEPRKDVTIGWGTADSTVAFNGTGETTWASSGKVLTNTTQEGTMNWSTVATTPIGIMDLGWSVWITVALLIIIVVRVSRTATWKSILLPVKWTFWATNAVCRKIWESLRRETDEAKRAWDEIRKDAK